MRLDEIQAMLCAVVSGPREVARNLAPRSLRRAVLRGRRPREAEALLRRLHDEIAQSLADKETTVAPVLYPIDEDAAEYDYGTWADAYVFGCGLAGDWYEEAETTPTICRNSWNRCFSSTACCGRMSGQRRALVFSAEKPGWWLKSRTACRKSSSPSTTSGRARSGR